MSDVVRECKRTWRRLGVPRDVAAEMAADLEADLAAAAQEDLRPEGLVGPDPRAFAAAWATERGVVRPRLHLVVTAGAAIVGAVPGAAFALFAAYGLASEPMAEIFGGELTRVGENTYAPSLSPPTWLLLTLYALGALFAYAGAVGAVAAALRWRLDPLTWPTVRSLTAALPVGTVASIAATVVYSASRGFSTDGLVVVGDVTVATGCFAATVAAVRLIAVRRERGRLAAHLA
jgi:hypothetical protein